jgi:uncharacterized protein (DUF1330 family)
MGDIYVGGAAPIVALVELTQTLAAFQGHRSDAPQTRLKEMTMAAYLLVDCEVTDPVRYENYKKLAPAAIARYGGRYLARGGATTRLEGDWRPNRIVVLEFPDADTARRFYDSPEYRAARAERAGAANMKMLLVEGV